MVELLVQCLLPLGLILASVKERVFFYLKKEEFKTCLGQFQLFPVLKGQFQMDGCKIKASLSLSVKFVSHRHEE